MIDLVRYEIFKLFRLKKAYFCVLAINFLPLLILFVFTAVYFKGLIYGYVGFTQQMFEKEFGMGVMGAIVFLLSFFSWSSWFFQTIIAGELISKEFENKSIKLMLLMPFTRFTIYMGKLLTTLVFYVFNLALYLGLTALLGVALHRVFGLNVFALVDYAVLFKICNAYFVINISYIALVFLVSIFARSAESTMAFTIFATFALKALDSVILLFGRLDIIPLELSQFLNKYAYLKTCEVIDSGRLMKLIETATYDQLPISFDMLGVNMLYTLLFLFIGFQIFRRKEEKG